jgi:hypothetical protein
VDEEDVVKVKGKNPVAHAGASGACFTNRGSTQALLPLTMSTHMCIAHDIGIETKISTYKSLQLFIPQNGAQRTSTDDPNMTALHIRLWYMFESTIRVISTPKEHRK